MYVLRLFAEMSVDSDRDSVIDSEDGKEAEVRLFQMFLALKQPRCSMSVISLCIFHITFSHLLCNCKLHFHHKHSDDDFNQEEDEDHDNPQKVLIVYQNNDHRPYVNSIIMN